MGSPPKYNPAKGKAIINPEDQIRYDRRGKGRGINYPGSCILCFSSELTKEAERKYGAKIVEKNWWGWLYAVQTVGSEFGILLSGIGSSRACLALELLIAKGARNIIAVGTAGGLQPSLGVGDIVLVSKAVRDEGVSRHYAMQSRYALPSVQLNRRIESALEELKLPFTKGVTWTMDAPFRETVGTVRGLQREGVLCVEMEASALFAVAKFRRAELSSLIWISDDVSRLKWNPQFHTARYRRGRDGALRTAVNVLSSND